MKKLPKISTPIKFAIGGSLLFLIYFLTMKSKDDNIPDTPDIDDVPNKPKGKTATQYTYGATQYLNFADTLFTAMNGPGTNEESIKRVMSSMKTYDDVLALITAYGKRKWSVWEFWDLNPKPLTLAEALESELDAKEIEKYVNEPLNKTGYKF
jgi:hypothetical protein